MLEINQRQSEASPKMVFKVNTPNKTDHTIGKGMLSEIVYIFEATYAFVEMCGPML